MNRYARIKLLATSLLAWGVITAGTSTELAAQPQIAYIIPDIGAAGMNTYVELIAPVGRPGSFDPGSVQGSGIYDIANLEIELVNPLDSLRVVISPGIVSWDGRLVSCQFFVHPDATPGPVPIRLRVNSARSNVDTFFIVTPHTLPVNATGPAVLGSGGDWGRRSKRGAMIVESLNLGNGSFTVDRNDTDPGTPGNQGLLPAVIISRTVVQTAPGTRLHVDAVGKDGGPGGGGGGGYGNRTAFPPVPGERNTPLGSGFTGGRSDVPGVGANPTSFGTGSGTGSASLNGVSANSQFTTTFPSFARLYGAGPGHPFDRDGRSGGAAAVAGGVGPGMFGTYYSGGGNAQKGSGAPTAQDDVNGQIVGNRQIVPLHGGGGGASGGANDSVGAGGGGGLALYSQGRTSISTIAAAGADGADGCHNCGIGSGDGAGGGAGGSIIIGGKSAVAVTTVDVKGGAAGQKGASAVSGSQSGVGGAGRFRFDGRIVNGVQAVTNRASVWTGPTIDTLTVVFSRPFRLSGTGRYDPNEQTNIQIYVRGEDSPWPDNGGQTTNTTVAADSTWEVDVFIPFNDSIFYIFAIQSTPIAERQGTDSATRVPSFVFSQAAANVVRYRPAPDLVLIPKEFRDTILCDDGALHFDTVLLRNRGAGALTIEQGGLSLGGEPGFAIEDDPTLSGPYVIPPGVIDTLIIRIDPTLFSSNSVTASLTVLSNDPQEPVSTHTINIELGYDRWYRTEPPIPGAIDFGPVPLTSSATEQAVVVNTGFRFGTTLRIDSVWITPPSATAASIIDIRPPDSTITDGDSLVVRVRFTPNDTISLQNVFLCVRTVEPCLDTICWPLLGRGIESVLTISKPEFRLDFPPCPTETEIFDTIFVGNDGGLPFNIESFSLNPAGEFALISPAAPPDIPVNSGDQIPLIIRYRPTSTGRPAADLLVRTDLTGRDSVRKIQIFGSYELAELTSSLDSLYLVTNCLSEGVDSTVTFANTGSVENSVRYRLAVGAEFTIDRTQEMISVGSSSDLSVTFTPTATGQFFDTLFVESEPCGLRDTIPLAGEVVPPDYVITQTPIDFSDVPIGQTGSQLVSIDPGTRPIRINARIVSSDGELQISNVILPLTISPPETGQIEVTWSPGSLKVIPPGSYLEITVESPCPFTIQIPISGESLSGGVVATPNPINFGAVVNCLVISDTVWVKNLDATGSITVQEIWLDPADPNFNVDWIDPSDPTPQIVAGDSVGLVVSYAPTIGPDGPQTTTLLLRTDSPSPAFDTLQVRIDGVRFSESLSITGPPFAPTFPGTASVQTYRIANTGTAPVAINRLVMSPPFRRVVTRPQLPTLLVSGASLEIDIEFAPGDTGTFVDSIVVDGVLQCDTIRLPISAVAEEPGLVMARWGDMSGEPGDQILIPLELVTDVSGLGIASLRVDANYDRTMLLAEGVEFAGGIATDWIVDDFARHAGGATITMSGPAPIDGSGPLLFLKTRVLLGEALQTNVTSTGASRITSGTGMLSIDSGKFSLEGYCTIGTNRLIRVSGEFGIKAVLPQPADDQLRIEYETVEDGPTRLRLVDLLGREVAILADRYQKGQVHEAILTEKLPAGTYLVLLETRTDRDLRVISVKN